MASSTLSLPPSLLSPENIHCKGYILESWRHCVHVHLVQGPDEVPGVVLAVAGDHAAGGDHPVPHPLQTVEHHPGGHAELRHLLLVTVGLGLVAQLLRQEAHLQDRSSSH